MSRLVEVLEFGPFRLDATEQRLWRDGGGAIALRPKTFALLTFLASRPGKLVRLDELLDAVWEGAAVTPGTVNTSIREIRKALGDDARQPTYIETVHRLGFRFVAEVRAETGPPRDELERLARSAARAAVRGRSREAAGYARRAAEHCLTRASSGPLGRAEREVNLELARRVFALGLPGIGPEAPAILEKCLDLDRRSREVGAGDRTADRLPEPSVAAALGRLDEEERRAVLDRYVAGSLRQRLSSSAASIVLGGLTRLGEALRRVEE